MTFTIEIKDPKMLEDIQAYADSMTEFNKTQAYSTGVWNADDAVYHLIKDGIKWAKEVNGILAGRS